MVDLLVQRALEGKNLNSVPNLVTIGSRNPAIDDLVDATTLAETVKNTYELLKTSQNHKHRQETNKPQNNKKKTPQPKHF